ncbi:MAG: hypothetical protein ABIQ18_03650 [Umezawaea sp.]
MFSKRRTRVSAILIGLLTASVALPSSAASTAGAAWTSWQNDLSGSRHNAAGWTTPTTTVGDLKLKWAFVFPKFPVFKSHSRPAVAGGTLITSSPQSTAAP